MKLELKHLAPYLPYELKTHCMGLMIDDYSDSPKPLTVEIVGLGDFVVIHEIGRTVYEEYCFDEVFPILRPLSDLTKEIDVNGEKFVPYIELLRECNFDVDNMSIEELEYYKPDKNELCLSRMYVEVVKLLEWQFDVFGLIEKGLAIDINTLKP